MKVIICETKVIICETKLIISEMKVIICEMRVILYEMKVIISETKVIICETKVIICETKVIICETKVIICETMSIYSQLFRLTIIRFQEKAVFGEKCEWANLAQFGSIWLNLAQFSSRLIFDKIFKRKKHFTCAMILWQQLIHFFMKLIKLSIAFTRYNDGEFENKAQYILACMTGNPAFTEPIPTLEDITTALAKYSTDLVAALGKDRIAVAEKNKSRKRLELLLGQLGLFVMFKATGDEAVLASSGYPMVKEREPRYITNPGNVTLANGVTSGEMVASVKKVKGAIGYLYDLATTEPAEDTVWTTTSCSKSRFVFKTLIPGKKYWVRVAATATGNQIAYSPVASQFAI